MRLCEEDIALTGKVAALEPLSMAHHEDLVEAVQDGDLHKLWYTTIPSAGEMRAEISRRLDLQRKGLMYPFAVKNLKTQRCVGMTTYMNIEQSQLRLEIGSTWLRKSIQRSAVNTECKWLLLKYAFEQLNCLRMNKDGQPIYQYSCLNLLSLFDEIEYSSLHPILKYYYLKIEFY